MTTEQNNRTKLQIRFGTNNDVKNSQINFMGPKRDIIYTCSRKNCYTRGTMTSGDIGQYSIGPEKDPRTMKFCSVRCWQIFKQNDLKIYADRNEPYPPNYYPKHIRDVAVHWVKKGYMQQSVHTNHVKRTNNRAMTNRIDFLKDKYGEDFDMDKCDEFFYDNDTNQEVDREGLVWDKVIEK